MGPRRLAELTDSYNAAVYAAVVATFVYVVRSKRRGGAYAAIPYSGGVFHACAKKT